MPKSSHPSLEMLRRRPSPPSRSHICPSQTRVAAEKRRRGPGCKCRPFIDFGGHRGQTKDVRIVAFTLICRTRSYFVVGEARRRRKTGRNSQPEQVEQIKASSFQDFSSRPEEPPSAQPPSVDSLHHWKSFPTTTGRRATTHLSEYVRPA